MDANNFKIVFTLDDDDTAYFRGLFRAARKAAKLQDEESVISGARSVLAQMRKTNKPPGLRAKPCRRALPNSPDGSKPITSRART